MEVLAIREEQAIIKTRQEGDIVFGRILEMVDDTWSFEADINVFLKQGYWEKPDLSLVEALKAEKVPADLPGSNNWPAIRK